jgi:hypothetical protein
MRLEFAFFADAAEVRPDGTMFVLGGGIDHVKGPSFPATHPGMALVARLMASQDEHGNHVFTVKVFRPRGESLPPDSTLTFDVPPNKIHPERGNTATVCLRYWNFLFPEPGEYTFRLYVDDREIGFLNFDAIVKE